MTDTPARDNSQISDISAEPAEHPAPIPWLAPVTAGITYLAFWQIVPRLRVDSEGAIVVSTLFSLGLIVWFTASLARMARSVRSLALSAFLSGVLILPLKVMLGTRHLYAPWSFLLWMPGLADLLFIWFAASFGAALSLLLRSANMIPPIAAVLALVDTWTVLLGGPVQRVMESRNAIAQAVTAAMTVAIPTPRVGASPFKPTSFVGFADFVFIAFFVAALCRLINVEGAYRKTVRAMIVVLCMYMLMVHYAPFRLLALPALVPMAVVMIGLHWRRFRYDRSEAFALLYAALVIVAIVLGVWIVQKRTPVEEQRPRVGRPITVTVRSA